MQSPRWLAGGALASVLGLVPFAAAQTLVRDINPTTSATNPGSEPRAIQGGPTFALVDADDGLDGYEPWITDGTAAGTRLLADIWPGSAGSLSFLDGSTAVDANGLVYFVAEDGVTGDALWRTDGTTAGTVRVVDLAGPGGGAPRLTAAGSIVYLDRDDGVHGLELWRTDGTPSGTAMVIDLAPGSASSDPRDLFFSAGSLWFVAYFDGLNPQLWRTDGTAAGTVLIHDFGTVSPPFVNGVGHLAAIGGVVCFIGYDAAHGSEPWRTDGTPSGTYLLRDINPGSASSTTLFFTVEVAASTQRVFFPANDGVSGVELWSTDGTAAGTTLVTDIAVGDSSLPHALTPFGSSIVFAADDGVHGDEPWVSDGTPAGTHMIRDVRAGAGSSTPSMFAPLGGGIWFRADDGIHGTEPWRTDGTSAGTAMIRDVWPGQTGSRPSVPAVLGGRVLFAADDGTHGAEPWITDGTSGGTTLVADIATPPGTDSGIRFEVGVGDRLGFLADDGIHGLELWRSDGTAQGTQLVLDLAPGSEGLYPNLLQPYRAELLLGAWSSTTGWTLAISDGTASGTRTLLTVNMAPPSPPFASIVFTPLGPLGDEYLLAVDDGVHGNELWKTDGTAAGTGLVLDIVPGPESSSPTWSTRLGGERFFFAGRSFPLAPDLWKTDGTAAGTVVAQSGGGTAFLNSQITTWNDVVWFTIADATVGAELWRTDGTTAGTSLVRDIAPGIASAEPRELVGLGRVSPVHRR